MRKLLIFGRSSLSSDMNEKELIAAQKAWLEKLKPLNKNRVLLGQYLEGDPTNFLKKWIELEKNDVVLTRQVLRMEVIFDFDYPTWSKVRSQAKKLVDYLNYANLEYMMATTGGKGIHVHLFMDWENIEIPNDVLLDCQKYEVDVWRVVRRVVFNSIVEKANLKVGTVKDREGLDTSKVYFTTMHDSKGSLIRDFGCPREDGNVKSLIKVVPYEKPNIKMTECVFPDKIVLTNIKRWTNEIEQALKEAIYNIKNNTVVLPENFKSKSRDIPCYNYLLKGSEEGIRNITVFTMARIAHMVGASMDETLKDMDVYCKNSHYKDSEARSTVVSAYRQTDQKPFCGTIKYTFGNEACNEKDCPINKYRKREV
jgi:hypothetical protein